MLLRREYTGSQFVGAQLPWYWGMSYRKLYMDRVVVHVVPFNLFVRWMRDFFFWIRSAGARGYRYKIEDAAYYRGLQDGQDNIRARLFCKVFNDLLAQGIPADNAEPLAKHILRAHMGI